MIVVSVGQERPADPSSWYVAVNGRPVETGLTRAAAVAHKRQLARRRNAA